MITSPQSQSSPDAAAASAEAPLQNPADVVIAPPPIADILPNFALVSVIFYPGLTMQHAVKHDEQSQSNDAMCAVNPSSVS